MARILLLIFFSGMLVTSCSLSGGERSYYLSPGGDDNNKGSLKKPWKTIDKLNAIILKPGDKIFFEGSQIFKGTLHLDSLDRGSVEEKIEIDTYGDGQAIIDGGNSEAVRIDRSEHFILRNLVIRGSGRKEGNITDGIFITNSGYYEVRDLDISGFQHSGLHIQNSKSVVVSTVHSHDNGFAGIHVSGEKANDPLFYENENVYIGYCVAYNNPGDPTVLDNHSGNGILASSVRDGTISNCEAFNNGWDMPWTGNGPVGIWIWDCTDFKIQYCISHHNKTNPVAADGGGFDFDGGVSNSVLQYCISYCNQGAGIGLFEFGAAKEWKNNVVRYNISRNDGILNAGSIAIWKGENGGKMSNCEIYNNTFYNDTAKGTALWLTTSIPGFSFSNNIFVWRGGFLGKDQKLTAEVFSNNCFWNLSGDQSFRGLLVPGNISDNIFADPGLNNPGPLDVKIQPRIDPELLSGYFLKSGSPLIDNGKKQDNTFGMMEAYEDLVITPVPQGKAVDIGAIEFKE